MSWIKSFALAGILTASGMANAATQYFSNEWVSIKVRTDSHAIAHTNTSSSQSLVVQGEVVNGKQLGKATIEVTANMPDAYFEVGVGNKTINGKIYGGIEKLVIKESPKNKEAIILKIDAWPSPNNISSSKNLTHLTVRNNSHSPGKIFLYNMTAYSSEIETLDVPIAPAYIPAAYWGGTPLNLWISQNSSRATKLARFTDIENTHTNVEMIHIDILPEKLKIKLRGNQGTVTPETLEWGGLTEADLGFPFPRKVRRNRDGTETTMYNLKGRDYFWYPPKTK